MAQKDTLTIYEELIATGVPEAQAKIEAHHMGELTDVVQELRKDMLWMRYIGAGMIAAFMANFFR